MDMFTSGHTQKHLIINTSNNPQSLPQRQEDMSIPHNMRLLRDKMELTAQLLDNLLLGDIPPMVLNLVAALGLSAPSLTRVLQTSNDALIISCLNFLNVISLLASDELVNYREYAEKVAVALEEVKGLYEASKDTGSQATLPER